MVLDVSAPQRQALPIPGARATLRDDRDGDLDLFVVNYLHWSVETELDCYNQMGKPDYCSPKNYDAPAMDTLYRNEGDGRFTDVTVEAGLNRAFGNGLGFAFGDYDDNGY